MCLEVDNHLLISFLCHLFPNAHLPPSPPAPPHLRTESSPLPALPTAAEPDGDSDADDGPIDPYEHSDAIKVAPKSPGTGVYACKYSTLVRACAAMVRGVRALVHVNTRRNLNQRLRR